jgi:cell wall-associated NlpC family hydrolase
VRASNETALKAVAHAREMIGKPYRYGGDTPAGFDCSGLVRYSYSRAGISLPRATGAQRSLATPIPVRNLRAGDLVFFDQEGKKASHVGLYLGDGRFVHAPSSGGRVRTDSLSADYWKKHFVDARRI